ncbi:MAG: hypothetical protein J2P50_05805, partial [Hyphomicrobiaceae bacterium]|nr:hypothetical protein [Hyphomicrobiaceae bacterium]
LNGAGQAPRPIPRRRSGQGPKPIPGYIARDIAPALDAAGISGAADVEAGVAGADAIEAGVDMDERS